MVNLSPTPSIGSEDFAYMLQEKPELYMDWKWRWRRFLHDS